MADISHIKELAKMLNLSNIAKGKVSLNGKYRNHLDFIEDVFLQEISFRKKSRIHQNRIDSRLPNMKFDKKYIIDGVKWQINKIKKLEFIDTNSNIIITGDCGVGKTSLAAEICLKALEQDKKVIYYTQDEYIKIVKEYMKTEKESAYYKKLKNADIIVIDEFLYLNINQSDLTILYKSLMFFNETHSNILISNRKVDKFLEASDDTHLMKTLVERINNNSHLIVL